MNGKKDSLSLEDSIQHIIQIATNFLQSDPTSTHAKDLICIEDDPVLDAEVRDDAKKLDEDFEIMIVEKTEASDDDLRIIEPVEKKKKNCVKKEIGKAAKKKKRTTLKPSNKKLKVDSSEENELSAESPADLIHTNKLLPESGMTFSFYWFCSYFQTRIRFCCVSGLAGYMRVF